MRVAEGWFRSNEGNVEQVITGMHCCMIWEMHHTALQALNECGLFDSHPLTLPHVLHLSLTGTSAKKRCLPQVGMCHFSGATGQVLLFCVCCETTFQIATK